MMGIAKVFLRVEAKGESRRFPSALATRRRLSTVSNDTTKHFLALRSGAAIGEPHAFALNVVRPGRPSGVEFKALSHLTEALRAIEVIGAMTLMGYDCPSHSSHG